MKVFLRAAALLVLAAVARAAELVPAQPHLTPEQTAEVARRLTPAMKSAHVNRLRGLKGEKLSTRIARLNGVNEEGADCAVQIELRPPLPAIGLPEARFPSDSTVATVSFIDPAKGIATVDDESVEFSPGPRVYADGMSAEIVPPTYALELEKKSVLHTRASKLGSTITRLNFAGDGQLASVRIENVSVVRFDGKPLERAQMCTFPLPAKRG